ncbi:polysaccharide deacetylase [Natrialba chahannaoensis JCM 10990]|uniref:Polysaccharide deacetylase n=1 Tax=Natrialba chahannaoensis JCM 10990 TaxID=1227492 RepID=M0B6J9_9EURY|nr:DUF2334 domain-containing protein [Natrialba chahannaoensis]ELZ06450.1 polysaccharide deacetylase [Natrialba chahannaoensis JCM 10990]
MSSLPSTCPVCGSRTITAEHIDEHVCGHVAPEDDFVDGCEKCTRQVSADDLTRLQTVGRCLECDARATDDFALNLDVAPPLPTVTFPTLPSREDNLNWLPARYVPESRLARQLLSSALVVMVLLAGITGAISVMPMLETESATVAAGEPEWEEYDSIVLFRNDDVQAWYNQDELRDVNQVFIDEEVPVTLGIIPDTNGEAPLTDDPDLCTYLQSLEDDYPGQFEMALHGYTHEAETDFYGASEFGDLPADEQRDRLEAGEELLDECVHSPSSTFIPPMNTYDETTVSILEEANYTTVSGGEWFTDAYFDANDNTSDNSGDSDGNNDTATDETVFEDGGLLHIPETQAFENWTAYEEQALEAEEADDSEDEDSNESNDETDVPFEDLETLTNSFDEAHAANDVHVVMFHYQYFTTDERVEQLELLVQHMKDENTGFLTIEQFALGLEMGTVEQTDDGWRVLEPAHVAITAEQVESSDEDTESEQALAAIKQWVGR